MATTVPGPVAHWHVTHEVGLCLFDRGQLMASQEAALYRDTRKSMFRYVTTHTQSVPNCEARSSLQEASFKFSVVSLRTGAGRRGFLGGLFRRPSWRGWSPSASGLLGSGHGRVGMLVLVRILTETRLFVPES